MTRRLVIAWWVVIASAIAGAGWVGYRALAGRRVAHEVARLADVLNLGATSRVADVGAGDGAFALALASRVVPQGQIFATEIDEKAVERLRARAAGDGLENVTTIRARADSTALPAACCDAAFLRGVYHHLTHPAETNASLHEALRPGARLAIIDFEPSWFLSTFFPVRDVPANRGGHGVPPDVAINELEQAGFRLVQSIDDWPRGQYCLVFQKPGG